MDQNSQIDITKSALEQLGFEEFEEGQLMDDKNRIISGTYGCDDWELTVDGYCSFNVSNIRDIKMILDGFNGRDYYYKEGFGVTLDVLGRAQIQISESNKKHHISKILGHSYYDCPRCKTKYVRKDHKFCPGCGSKIIWNGS